MHKNTRISNDTFKTNRLKFIHRFEICLPQKHDPNLYVVSHEKWIRLNQVCNKIFLKKFMGFGNGFYNRKHSFIKFQIRSEFVPSLKSHRLLSDFVKYLEASLGNLFYIELFQSKE